MRLCAETKHLRWLLDLNHQLYSHISTSGKTFSVYMCSTPRAFPWLCSQPQEEQCHLPASFLLPSHLHSFNFFAYSWQLLQIIWLLKSTVVCGQQLLFGFNILLGSFPQKSFHRKQHCTLKNSKQAFGETFGIFQLRL